MTELTPCARGCKIPGAHLIQHEKGSSCPGCRPRIAMRGTTVCAHCADVFRTALRDLRIIWPDLKVGVSRDRKTSTAGGQRVQSSSSADAGDMWRPHVTRSLTEIVEWLEFVGIALTGTRVRTLRGIKLEEATPELALAALAYSASPILTSHPDLAEALVGEAARLRDRAHAALSTRFVRRIPLTNPAAKCVIDIEIPDPEAENGYRLERCNGDLVAVLQPDDVSRSSSILCSRFPIDHAVPTTSWGALADELAAAVQ